MNAPMSGIPFESQKSVLASSSATRTGDCQATASWTRLLNIGCGSTFHPAWRNLDLVPADSQVEAFDISRGLPCPDASLDAVYHSHVLEHLDVEEGRRLIGECFRVLRPGGILRVVVPDLEQIARLYLELHQQAWQGDGTAREKYEWIKLELLDQLVRSRSGGRMGQFMAGLEDDRAGFVRSRVGVEYQVCKASLPAVEPPASPAARPRPSKPSAKPSFRSRLARWVVKKLEGPRKARLFDEASFRANGEIHRWMYDRVSLRDLCESAGFGGFQVCSASHSRIAGFDHYNLDVRDGEIRKPDSLFVECVRPA